jgi:type II secretory pathway pseudopilin PulG
MNKHKAFTIVELLTSIVIIVILLGLLLPSIAMVRKMAKETAQKAQFATIDMTIEAFKQDYGDYPPSDMLEPPSPGLMGFDPNTAWRRDGFDAYNGRGSYDPPPRTRIRPDGQYYTLFERRGPYLDVSKTPVFRLGTSNATANDGLYDSTSATFVTYFDATQQNFVICDVFGVKKVTDTTGKISTAGTPVLYYKANTNSKSCFCVPPPNLNNSIYNYRDNLPLLSLNILPNATIPHKLISPQQTYFCDPTYKIDDEKVPPLSPGVYWPHRPDTYILISAGADHEFGTKDDILNF